MSDYETLCNMIDMNRKGSSEFYLSRDFYMQIRKAKTDGGNYIWEPGICIGAQSTILGHPVCIDSEMQEMARFGDVRLVSAESRVPKVYRQSTTT